MRPTVCRAACDGEATAELTDRASAAATAAVSGTRTSILRIADPIARGWCPVGEAGAVADTAQGPAPTLTRRRRILLQAPLSRTAATSMPCPLPPLPPVVP